MFSKKNKLQKSLAILLIFMMVFTTVGVQMPVAVEAATKIAFSCTAKTVAIGGTYTLTVQGVTDKKATYVWSSSDKEVAKVSAKGVVTGIDEGSATIKCKITLSDKSTKTLSCKVTVKEQKVATSVKISNAKLDENNVHTIVVGETYDFNRKLSPSKSNDKTYWYIQDEQYAEVDANGVVTAKKAGTTTLIAKVGIDRVSAEEANNKVVASVQLNLVASTNKVDSIEEISKASIGDYIFFGNYEQDNNTANGAEAIEWQVLDKKDGKVLLLSKYALDCKKYNEQWGPITWENCTLRSWLNGEFYSTAFTSTEQKYIAESYLMNENNSESKVNGGNNTYDKVFLLSIGEVKTYFDSNLDVYDAARGVQVTEYAKAHGGWDNDNEDFFGDGAWWLRSPGFASFSAAGVYLNGYVDCYGYNTNFSANVVRPALWVDVNVADLTEKFYTIEEISKASTGDYVIFGNYEQDNNILNGTEAIEWKVLDKKDDKLLLISKYGLDCKKYNEKVTTWENCTLRSWLNGEFYNTAFTGIEQQYIEETYVINGDNPMHDTEGGNNTYDKIFLLSMDEATRYFASDLSTEDPARSIKITEYAKAQGGWYSELEEYYGNCQWWLRTPGFYKTMSSAGNYRGGVDWTGYDVTNDAIVVRPAFWINIDCVDSTARFDSIKEIGKVSIGDYIIFGNYEQDNNTLNGAEEIEWQVLDKKDGKVLLLSKYALDVKSYHEEWEDVTWETCTLRSWLNEDFYKTAFTNVEQKYIAETYVINVDNTEYGTDGGNNTYDKVFLLSIDEVATYFASDLYAKDPARRVQVTEYAKGKFTSSTTSEYHGIIWWWLRSLGENNRSAVNVSCNDGNVGRIGNAVDYRRHVVRPALWVEVNSIESTDESGFIEEIGNVSIGDYVTFGTYEQDNNEANGVEAIEWQVLDKKDGKVLLLSKYALDAKPYHEKWGYVTWEECTLRRWLNEDFYKTAFTNVEQKYITETYVINKDNPEYGTDGGNNTYDKVFLLSMDEMTTYFNPDPYIEDTARGVKVTEYAKAQGGWYSPYTEYYYGNGCWWLRSPGEDSDIAAIVAIDGYIECMDIGGIVDRNDYVVRPTLWVEIE